MSFAAIKGQSAALSTLRNALAADRLAHAYLFVGPSGVGKKRTALALAQALLCTEQVGTGCESCAACRAVVSGAHPDLSLVTPQAGKTTLVIDQVRELQHFLGLQSARGSRKIAVVEEAQVLTPQAQSGLLKIVEEPPGAALLMLLSVSAASLSRPLLSRCQQVRFAALPLATVEELLVQEHDTPPAEAHALALYSRGSIGRALSLDAQVFTEERQYLIEELGQIERAPFSRVSGLAEWLVASRSKKSRAKTDQAERSAGGDRLELALSWYEERLRYVLLGQDGVIRYADCLPAITQTAQGLSVEEALRQLSLVYDTIGALSRNANARLAVEDMLLQLAARDKSER
jgi:DNA polymerase-3 subunit delta'